MGTQGPARRLYFLMEMNRDLRRNSLRAGELRVFEDVIVFADTMRIMHRHSRHVWLCRPERFPWIVVRLRENTICLNGYIPMPLGTRIHARIIIWRSERLAYAAAIEGPAAFRRPLQLSLPLNLPHRR